MIGNLDNFPSLGKNEGINGIRQEGQRFLNEYNDQVGVDNPEFEEFLEGEGIILT